MRERERFEKGVLGCLYSTRFPHMCADLVVVAVLGIIHLHGWRMEYVQRGNKDFGETS